MNNRPSDERNVPDEQHVQAHTHDTSADFHQETLEFANVVNAQNAELQEYARVFLLKAMRLRGVAVKREQFLRAELPWTIRPDHRRSHRLNPDSGRCGSGDFG